MCEINVILQDIHIVFLDNKVNEYSLSLALVC